MKDGCYRRCNDDQRTSAEHVEPRRYRSTIHAIEPVEFESYESTERRFETEVRQYLEARDPSAVRRDVTLLESKHLVRTRKVSNPGHGVQTVVERAAASIELAATV